MSASGTNNPIIGVREVWRPPTGKEPTVDIVAVHGLGGHAFGTWTAKGKATGLDHDVFWLRDLLPQEVPNARILTYGYDSSPAKLLGSANTSMVHHHAANLVSELHHFRRRDNERHRPIIFVVHSLGGIIVKRALIYSNGGTLDHNLEYRSIKVSTYGVVFLGTPHMGADLAKWGKWTEWLVSTVAPKAVIDTNDAIVKTLEKNSETLQNITEQFLSIASDFRLFFFWETQPTSIKGMTQAVIVDYSSAVVDLPNAGKYGIHATHSEMCKFVDEYAPGWNVLAGVLVEYVKNAPRDVETAWRTEHMRQEHTKRIRLTNQMLELQYGRSRSPSPSNFHTIGSHTSSPDLLGSRNIPKLIGGTDESDNVIPGPLVVKPDSLQENDYFEGREREMKTLHKMLYDSNKRTVCISCVTGGGKTHLARHYFFTKMDHYPGGAFWIDCKSIKKTMSMEQLDYGYSKIAEKLKLPPPIDMQVAGETVDPRYVTQMQVTDWFSRNDGWLLVLDGLDIEDDAQLDLVSGYVPRGRGGSILITTLNSSLREAARLRFPDLLELERVEFQSAKNMLFHFADIKAPAIIEREKDAAGELVRAMGFSPLALHSAGSYIKARRMSVTDYVKQYKKRPFVEREFLPSLHLIFDRIAEEEKYKETHNLLRILAFFDREIPVEMLLWGIKAVNDVQFSTRESGHTLFDNTIHHLLTFSLVDRTRLTEDGQQCETGEIDTLLLHSVAQDVIIARMREKDRARTGGMSAKPTEVKMWLRHAIDVFCGSFEALQSRRTVEGIESDEPEDFLISDYRRFEVHGRRLIAHAQRQKIVTSRLDEVLKKIDLAINADGNSSVHRRSMFRSGSLTESLSDTPVSSRTPSWNMLGRPHSESPTEHRGYMEGNGHAADDQEHEHRKHVHDELTRLQKERPFQFRYEPPKGPRNPFARPQRASTGIEPRRARASPTNSVYTVPETASAQAMFSPNSGPGPGTTALQNLMNQRRAVAPSRPGTSQSNHSFWGNRTPASTLVRPGHPPGGPAAYASPVFSGPGPAFHPAMSAYNSPYQSPARQFAQPVFAPQLQRPALPGRGRSGSLPTAHSAPPQFGMHPLGNSSSPTLPHFDSDPYLPAAARAAAPPPPLQFAPPVPYLAYGSRPLAMPPYPVTPLGPPPGGDAAFRPGPFSPGFTPPANVANSPTARSIVGPRDRPPSECWSEPIPEHGSFSYGASAGGGSGLGGGRAPPPPPLPHAASPPPPPPRSLASSRAVSPLVFQMENVRGTRPGTGNSAYAPPPLRRPPAVANLGADDEPGRFSPPGIAVDGEQIVPFAAPAPPDAHAAPPPTRHLSLDDTLDRSLSPPRLEHPLRRSSIPGEEEGSPPAAAEAMQRSSSEPGKTIGNVLASGHVVGLGVSIPATPSIKEKEE